MSALLVVGLVVVTVLLLIPGPAGQRPAPRDAGTDVELSEDVRRRRAAAAVGLAAAVSVLLLAPGWLALAALPVGLLAWRRAARLETGAHRRRREALEGELPHLVDLVRALVASGAAPDRALERVRGAVSEATSAELRPWVTRLLLGGDPSTVWAELARHPQLGRLGAAMHRATVGGAPVGEALQRLSTDLRAARRAEVHRRVREVEVRATAPLGACLLPAFVLLGVVPLVAGAAGGLLPA
jgi:Flp pilus assembly protein TadB